MSASSEAWFNIPNEKEILMLYLGGTIGMKPNQEGGK